MLKASAIGLLAFLVACSSTSTRKTDSRLGGHSFGSEITAETFQKLRGKKVALISIESDEGDDTARRVVEVALVNQIARKGSFILIPKEDMDQARATSEQNPLDWRGVARRAGADYALKAHVLEFHANHRTGYSSEEVYDSQIAEEQGTDGKTERVYRADSLDGQVRIELQLTQMGSTEEMRNGIAQAQDHIQADAKSSAIHLPPQLRFLETLTNRAFQDFFDRLD